MYKVSSDGIEYYTIDRIKDIQDQMLRLLRIVDSICRENNLQYFLDGGSAIGAYRHSGFIPWDDDLDITLLKPDYIKLVDILKRLDRTKYFLFDYEQELHPAAFLGEKVPFFSCADNKKRHIYPIKLDISPLNLVEDSEQCIKENRVFRELSNLLFFGDCSDAYRNQVEDLFERRFGNERKRFMKYYNFQYGLYLNYENAVLARPSMFYSTPKVYPYRDVFPLQEITFEGMKTYVPATDVILKEIYGDYMKLPSVEDRRPEAQRVLEARNVEVLYKYLIDKSPKTLLQKVIFSLEANLLCK